MGQNFENGAKLKILKRASFGSPQIRASFVNDAHASFPLKKFPGHPRVIWKRRARQMRIDTRRLVGAQCPGQLKNRAKKFGQGPPAPLSAMAMAMAMFSCCPY